MPASEPAKFTEDGELLEQIFCVYCNGLNQPYSEECFHCGKYIADQGPDLRARLSRLRRYAYSVHEHDTISVSAPNTKDTLQIFCANCGNPYQQDEMSCWYCGGTSIYEQVEWTTKVNLLKRLAQYPRPERTEEEKLLSYREAFFSTVWNTSGIILFLMLILSSIIIMLIR